MGEEGEAGTCPICGSPSGSIFFRMDAVPVHVGLQWPTRQAARACPRGDIRLALCPACDFIWNERFEPERLHYAQGYDNCLDYSGVFCDYSRDLALELIEQYGLQGKLVVDVGCGHGAFLHLICDLGGNRGVGFEPGLAPGQAEKKEDERVEFVRDYFSERYTNLHADFICCRFVLEHTVDAMDFLHTIREAVTAREHAVFFCEVPNMLAILRGDLVWDVIYEHHSYFSRWSLEEVFLRSGFAPRRVRERFHEQYLSIEAEPAESNAYPGPLEQAPPIGSSAQAFSRHFESKRELWKLRLAEEAGKGRRVAAWGAGAKAVTFMNAVDSDEVVEYVVDINPRKQGTYLAGTGQEIVAPGHLNTHPPDTVIVMNPVYIDEIRETLKDSGLRTELLCA